MNLHENISIDWDKVKEDELASEDKFNMEHAGHAEKRIMDTHTSMILILIVVLIVSQVCLVQWKKWKPYSYHICTLAGMSKIKYVFKSIDNNQFKACGSYLWC